MSIPHKAIKLRERDEDGCWIYLRDGFCDAQNPGCHTIVEADWSEVFLHDVIPCRCAGCVKERN